MIEISVIVHEKIRSPVLELGFGANQMRHLVNGEALHRGKPRTAECINVLQRCFEVVEETLQRRCKAPLGNFRCAGVNLSEVHAKSWWNGDAIQHTGNEVESNEKPLVVGDDLGCRRSQLEVAGGSSPFVRDEGNE